MSSPLVHPFGGMVFAQIWLSGQKELVDVGSAEVQCRTKSSELKIGTDLCSSRQIDVRSQRGICKPPPGLADSDEVSAFRDGLRGEPAARAVWGPADLGQAEALAQLEQKTTV